MNNKPHIIKICYIMVIFFTILAVMSSNVSTTAQAADLIVKKVTLDPGHGWADSFSGAAANGMLEKDVALEIANLVKPMLEAYGVQVSMTRTSDEPNLDLMYAAIRANEFQSDLVVSIHLNGGGGTGTESCYQVVGSCSDPFSSECINRPDNENSKRLATLLTQKVNSTLGLTIRGDFREHTADRCDRYATTRWTKLYIHDMNMPAAIIETAFIDGPADVDVKMLKERRSDFAKAITDAVLAYLSISTNNESKVTDIPNPDTYSCSQPGYVDFEDFTEGTNLSSGTIAGMQFTTTNGYSWLVGDFDAGNYNGKYPNGGYTSQGTHWAWLGVTQGAGRIDFPKGPASYFSLLVSNNTEVSVDAYSASGEKLATAGPAQSNYYTGHMTELKITRATADMAYVMVHDQGNFFAIDGVCTDAPGTPNTINRIVDETYFMQTGQRVTGNFFINFISGFWRYLRIFIGPFFSDVDLILTRPDGTIVKPGDPDVTFNKTENYIEVIIEGANSGQWNYEIIANELEPGGENIRIIVDEQLIVSGDDNNDADTTGVFRPSNGALYLKNQNTTGFADIQINYGLAGDYPVVGDWNGNGTDTIGVYRNGVFYLRNSNTIGYADVVFAFGSPGDQPIAGDWDGDGIDTIGVYRSSTGTFYLRNSNSTGVPDMIFALGIPGDVGIAGDWNNDGFDTTGVFRPSNGALYLKNQNTTGFADIQINYGLPGDKPVTGDWDNDGTDTIGIYRNGTFYLRNENTIGYADIVFDLGIPGDMPIAGNWDGLP